MAHGERDALWWTELELRRLGNVVAEMLHSRRFAHDVAERAQLRLYLDAMRRKSLRVLHRAERVGDGADSVWLGLDPGLLDPVALGEEYVRCVEMYETQFGDTPNEEQCLNEIEEWEKRDAREYAEALAREEKGERSQLLAGATSGLRLRKPANYTKEDEQFMERHRPVQEQLTAELADAVGKLKGSVSRIGDQLKNDDAVVDETADAVDANLAGMKKQREQLAKLERSSSFSFWSLLVLTLGAIVVFIVLLVFLLL